MKKIFTKHEIQFILWFAGIFLISVALLAVTGLIPTEFQSDGGQTFEQRTRNAIREIIEGTSTAPILTATNNNGNIVGTSNGNGNSQNSGSQIPGTTGQTQQNTQITIQEIKVDREGKTTTNQIVIQAEDPLRLEIPSISVDTIVENPKSTNPEVLDAELTKGAVHYPGSGMPGSGNMFIFGHSTGFSVVQNKAYKVFNRLKDLKNGETITVYGKDWKYEYRVTSVRKVDKSDALVTFDTKTNMITLSTCDSFGRAQDRYVVEGELIGIVKR